MNTYAQQATGHMEEVGVWHLVETIHDERLNRGTKTDTACEKTIPASGFRDYASFDHLRSEIRQAVLCPACLISDTPDRTAEPPMLSAPTQDEILRAYSFVERIITETIQRLNLDMPRTSKDLAEHVALFMVLHAKGYAAETMLRFALPQHVLDEFKAAAHLTMSQGIAGALNEAGEQKRTLTPVLTVEEIVSAPLPRSQWKPRTLGGIDDDKEQAVHEESPRDDPLIRSSSGSSRRRFNASIWTCHGRRKISPNTWRCSWCSTRKATPLKRCFDSHSLNTSSTSSRPPLTSR